MRIEPPNPVVFGKNNVVDWKGPLQLPGRLVPCREAFFDQQSSRTKVQRKVQETRLYVKSVAAFVTQVFGISCVTSSGR
jgi:hypothetical protein